eukprot:7670168-Pyramimonas_sp.AAC.1
MALARSWLASTAAWLPACTPVRTLLCAAEIRSYTSGTFKSNGYIQSDAGSVGIFQRWTNQTQEAWVCSHGGPIRRRKRG